MKVLRINVVVFCLLLFAANSYAISHREMVSLLGGGGLKEVKQKISSGYYPDERSEKGLRLIGVAAHYGITDVVEYLLSAGSDPKGVLLESVLTPNEHDYPPEEVIQSYSTIVKLLVKAGDSPNVLVTAAQKGNLYAIIPLIENGADAKAVDVSAKKDGVSAEAAVVDKPGRKKVKKRKKDQDAADGDVLQTLLTVNKIKADRHSNPEAYVQLVEYLAAKGCNRKINIYKFARNNGHAELKDIKKIVDIVGSDVVVTEDDMNNMTALYASADAEYQKGNMKQDQYDLLKKMFTVMSNKYNGTDNLDTAIKTVVNKHNQQEMTSNLVQVLGKGSDKPDYNKAVYYIKQGADVNANDMEGNRALVIRAIDLGNEPLIKEFITHGVKLDRARVYLVGYADADKSLVNYAITHGKNERIALSLLDSKAVVDNGETDELIYKSASKDWSNVVARLMVEHNRNDEAVTYALQRDRDAAVKIANNCATSTCGKLIADHDIRKANEERIAAERSRLAKIEREKQAALAAENERKRSADEWREFQTLGICKVGNSVTHRERYEAKAGSGNILADALFYSNTKEWYNVEYEGYVKAVTANSVEVHLQDFAISNKQGGIIGSNSIDVKQIADKANAKIGKSFFFKRSRCSN